MGDWNKWIQIVGNFLLDLAALKDVAAFCRQCLDLDVLTNFLSHRMICGCHYLIVTLATLCFPWQCTWLSLKKFEMAQVCTVAKTRNRARKQCCGSNRPFPQFIANYGGVQDMAISEKSISELAGLHATRSLWLWKSSRDAGCLSGVSPCQLHQSAMRVQIESGLLLCLLSFDYNFHLSVCFSHFTTFFFLNPAQRCVCWPDFQHVLSHQSA